MTWQEKAKKYIEVKNNPYADQRTMEKLKEGLEWVNTNGLSDEDRQLLAKVFWG